MLEEDSTRGFSLKGLFTGRNREEKRSTEELEIRRYQASDKDKIWELSCKALDPIFPNQERRKGPRQADFDNIEEAYASEKRADFLVGTVGGKIVAIAGLQQKPEDRDIAEHRRWRVDPDNQRKGYGARMLQAIEDSAREFGYKTIQAVTVTSLKDAIKQYQKNGYQEVKREPLPEEWNLEANWVYFEKQL